MQIRRSCRAALGLGGLALAAILWTHTAHAATAPPPAGAPAQDAAAPGRLIGTVVDASGGAVAGAVVTLRTPDGERRATSDNSGTFTFDRVPKGSLTGSASFPRFAPASIALDAPRAGLRLVLQPVPITEEVTVSAAAPTAARVTAAARTGAPLLDVPQAVTVVTRELIADQTMDSMADVVNYVPGVGMAQGEGHRDAPIFRGNTSTSDFFVDGLRDDTQYLRDLYNVERVEVLKGPNGLLFGRGGIGGVINRVTRQADFMPTREVMLQGGSWGHRRLTADLGNAVGQNAAARVTGMYENSGTFRDHVDVERYGVNPTVAFGLGPDTILRAGYDFFHDERTTDRGIPSLGGAPLDVEPDTFFGDAALNRTDVTVNALSAALEHRFNARVTLINRVRFADYAKFYQNLVPGAVNAAQATVPLTGYNNDTQRQNVFNQTDLILTQRTGRINHTVLAGVEVGRQVTDNLRMTGYFPGLGASVTSVSVPLDNPLNTQPVEFRSSATDANNHGVATAAAVYVQDEVALSPQVDAIVGLRYDRFAVDFLDNRTASGFTSRDGLLSPRVGVVYKPVTPVSLYASYSRSYLPRAGEQLSSLSLSNVALEPEEFRNYEAGVKWEIAPPVALTAALYRLTHGNVVVRDAVDPAVSHLVDAERTAGLEIELAGSLSDRWVIQGGYAYQDGKITESLSAAVVAGARLAQVPRHSFSVWNKYDVTSKWGAGVGVITRSDVFVATDNRVVLPGFARVDTAVFFTPTARVRASVNVENLFDERYYWSAHNNTNIAPGSPRAVRVALTTRF